jgi:hypothetical protein
LSDDNIAQLSLGAEYESIARSILAGNGYANPFTEETGKTAWMPPVLVFIEVVAFYLFNNKIYAFFFLSFLKIVAFILTIYWMYVVFKKLRLNYFFVFYACFLLYLLFSPNEVFERIGDLWLAIVLQAAFFYTFINFRHESTRKNLLYLCIPIFLAPITNPSVAIGLVFVVAFFYVQDISGYLNSINNDKKGFWQNSLQQTGNVSILALVFIIPITIWGYRNYQELGKFIPTKSNLWFEFYQANVVDHDGCLSFSTLTKAHPITNEEVRTELIQLGEVAWVSKYEHIAKDYVSRHQDVYLKKLLSRFSNVFIYSKLDDDEFPAQTSYEFSAADLQVLEHNNYIQNGNWLTLELKPQTFQKKLDQLPLAGKTNIYEDWKVAKQAYIDSQKNVPYIIRNIFISGLATICILILLFTNLKKNLLIKSGMIIYIGFSIPYVLVSHFLRYQRPLFLIQAIFLALVLGKLYDWYIARAKRHVSKPVYA